MNFTLKLNRSVILLTDERTELNIPQSDIDSLARMILPQIQAYYESEQGKQAFSEWKGGLKGE